MDSETSRPSCEELSRALEESENAYRNLAVLTYSFGHDLRAPLRSISGYTQVMLVEHAGQLSEECVSYLNRMKAAGDGLTKLVDAFLKLVSLERGEVRRADVDLSAAAESIAAALRLREPSRQVEFVIQPGLKASGDPDLVTELLEILLGNAWKFTSLHPRARIEFGRGEHEGREAYCVRDDGAGFDPLHAGKLFTAFQRLHRAAEFPGIGAGLAVAARIARLHGGWVAAEGNVEKGAAFFFTLSAEK
jgi:light-regulated signal transduction histidine kinase (bacteriophytochrome)